MGKRTEEPFFSLISGFFSHEAALSAEGGFAGLRLLLLQRKKECRKKHNQLHIYIYELCMLERLEGGDPA